MCGGVSLYLLGHIAFRLRNLGTLNKQRSGDRGVAAAFIPVATEIDAMWTVGAMAVLTCGLIAYEAIRFKEARERIRETVHA